MAYLTQSDLLETVSSRSLLIITNNLVARVRRYRRFRTTYKELSALSSTQLKDLGLNHSMIRRLALEASLDT
ncbi:DUF1127 domain-containing protein [Pseudopelagicola sp. nBUS_19]|uniref:DUF1127 domain-containing protein n=1 Tax=unclassified Pseudopelagicola TaxID=2649563 RepID=UPI003EB9E464